MGRPLPGLPRAGLTASDDDHRRTRRGPRHPPPRAGLGPVGGAGARRAAARLRRSSRALPSSTRSCRCSPTPTSSRRSPGWSTPSTSPGGRLLPAGGVLAGVGRAAVGAGHGVEVRFADLPDHAPARRRRADGADEPDATTDGTDATPAATAAPRPDAIGTLAAAAGYDDPERWWEDAVEHRGTSSPRAVRAPSEAMAAVREADDRGRRRPRRRRQRPPRGGDAPGRCGPP